LNSALPIQFGLRTLLSLAWPIILARSTQAAIGFTDALFVAPLGEVALAATTTGALNSFAMIILPMGVVFILQSFSAQLRGRGELLRVRDFAIYGLMLALLAGVIAALAIPFVPNVLGLLEVEPEVLSLMSSYVSIRLWSVGPAVGMEALGNWYGGLGNTRAAMVASVVAMVANVIGTYALVLPHFGLPGYGVEGAAWASVVASWLGFFVIAWGFIRGRGFELPKAKLNPRWNELWRVIRFGLPNGVNWFLEFSAFTIFVNFIVGHYGTTVLTAFNVVLQINSIAFMPAFGLSSAGAILVGETIGARKLDAVWPIVRLTGVTAACWMLTVGLLYSLFPEFCIGLFAADHEDSHALVKAGSSLLILSAFWQLFDALVLTFSEALRAAGDTTWCMLARIIVAWLVFTPAAWLLVRVWGGDITTMMLSLIGYIVLLALTFGWRFASQRWQKIDLVGEPSVI
jgi:multidrug resistance protein, MATE family